MINISCLSGVRSWIIHLYLNTESLLMVLSKLFKPQTPTWSLNVYRLSSWVSSNGAAENKDGISDLVFLCFNDLLAYVSCRDEMSLNDGNGSFDFFMSNKRQIFPPQIKENRLKIWPFLTKLWLFECRCPSKCTSESFKEKEQNSKNYRKNKENEPLQILSNLSEIWYSDSVFDPKEEYAKSFFR